MKASKLCLGLLSATALFSTIGVSSVAAKETDPVTESLCRKFPLNSQCQDRQIQAATVQTHQLDRQSFCDRFPFNSQCQQSIETIKLRLDRSGEKDEWIEIEKRGEVKLWHSTKVKDGLISGILNTGLGAIPIPVPLPELNKYNWQDHQTVRVSFQSDDCKNPNCVVYGTADTLIMPDSIDLYGGMFTLNYQEEDLKRAVSFRIPPEVKAETPDTLTVKFNN